MFRIRYRSSWLTQTDHMRCVKRIVVSTTMTNQTRESQCQFLSYNFLLYARTLVGNMNMDTNKENSLNFSGYSNLAWCDYYKFRAGHDANLRRVTGTPAHSRQTRNFDTVGAQFDLSPTYDSRSQNISTQKPFRGWNNTSERTNRITTHSDPQINRTGAHK